MLGFINGMVCHSNNTFLDKIILCSLVTTEHQTLRRKANLAEFKFYSKFLLFYRHFCSIFPPFLSFVRFAKNSMRIYGVFFNIYVGKKQKDFPAEKIWETFGNLTRPFFPRKKKMKTIVLPLQHMPMKFLTKNSNLET